MLAWRYLRARRTEGFISLTTWFAVIGITLGVATLILVTSLMNGIRAEMTTQFIGIDGHITVYGQTRAFQGYAPIVDQLKQLAGVKQVVPRITGQVMASAHGVALGAQAVATPWDILSTNALFTSHIESGSLDGLRDGTGIALGSHLARNLGVRVGDSVTLISPQGRATIAGFIPRIKAYPVVATFKLGMHEFDSSLVLMPFAEAQTYFLLAPPEGQPVENGAISNISISVMNADDAPAIATAVRQHLGNSARVYDWQEINAGVFAALTVQRNVMVIILALIILVAAFNIISSLVMLVKDKGRDIAVLRTMGATQAGVMRIFITAGTMIGVVGTTAGIVLGLLLAAFLEPLHHLIEKLIGQEILPENIYFLSTLPTKTDPVEVIVIVLLALALSFLSALYPARRAAKLDPAEALRYE
jgi:lipoprotein-releasing system permease protein